MRKLWNKDLQRKNDALQLQTSALVALVEYRSYIKLLLEENSELNFLAEWKPASLLSLAVHAGTHHIQ